MKKEFLKDKFKNNLHAPVSFRKLQKLLKLNLPSFKFREVRLKGVSDAV